MSPGPRPPVGLAADSRIGVAAAAGRQIVVTGVAWSLRAVAGSLASLTGLLMHRLLLAIVVLDIPFRLEKNLAYREDMAALGSLGGFSMSITTIALVLLYVRWALRKATSPIRDRFRVEVRDGRPLVAYLAFATLSTLGAGDVGLASRELFLLGQVFLVYLYLVNNVSMDDVRWMVTILVAGLALESLAMLYGAYSGETVSVAGRTIRVDTQGSIRVGGTVGSPNGAATHLTLLMAPTVALLLTTSGGYQKAAAVLCAVLAVPALLSTQSRGGWLAAFLSLTMLWLASVRYLRRPFLASLPVIGLAVGFVAFSGTIATRISGDDNGSVAGRWPLMQTAMKMIRDHPLLGVGPNNYASVMKDYGAVSGDWGNWVYTVHNKFLLVWAETGPGGLISFLWFLVATIRLGWRGWKARHPWFSPVALGFTCALIGHVVHMQVDLFTERPQVEMLWVAAALLSVIHAGTRSARISIRDVPA